MRNPSINTLQQTAMPPAHNYRELIPLQIRSRHPSNGQVTIRFNRPVDARLVLIDGDQEQRVILGKGFRGRSGDTPLFIPSHRASDLETQATTGSSSTSSDSIEALNNLDDFRAKHQCYGQGVTVAVLDSGARLTHDEFLDDSGASGASDAYDFGDRDNDASDANGHGTNVAGIIGARSTGIAPQVHLIILKVFTNRGSGTTRMLEEALQWVDNNRATHSIVAVNMSLGDSQNWDRATPSTNSIPNKASIIQASIIRRPIPTASRLAPSSTATKAASSPRPDPRPYSSAADVIAAFSQRHSTLLTTLAPGVEVVSAGRQSNTATSTYSGTSQATPHLASAVALAQELARKRLGRWLSFNEVSTLLKQSDRRIIDGDDEDDNVTNTGLAWKRIDMLALGDAIAAMGNPDDNDTAPMAPSNLRITTTSASITLAWNDNSTNETGFELLRASDSTFTTDRSSVAQAPSAPTPPATEPAV